MEAKLEVVRGAKPLTLSVRLPTTIGRGGDSKLKLPASTVSRNHCELYEYEGQLAVRDLGSSNGTLVNGHKIEAPTFLTTHDILTVGPVTLRPVSKPEGPVSKPEGGTPGMAARAAEDAVCGSPAAETPDRTGPDDASPADPDAGEVAGPDPRVCEDSVLEYSERSEGSFIGITTAEEVPKGAGQSPTDVPAFEGVGEGDRPTVDSDDSKLNSFFKNLDKNLDTPT